MCVVITPPFTGIAALTMAIVTIVPLIWFWGRLCANLVGGQTGDLIGALQALLEIALLAAFIIGMSI